MSSRTAIWLLLAGAWLVGCRGAPSALKDGATWLTQTPPPELAASVTSYEQRQHWGADKDEYAWQSVTRYTTRVGTSEQYAGCSFVARISGTWTTRASTLVVDANPDSAALEVFGCPGNAAARNLPDPPTFSHAESAFELRGRTLSLERQFGASPPYAVVLTREN